jgi:hypothetical protein
MSSLTHVVSTTTNPAGRLGATKDFVGVGVVGVEVAEGDEELGVAKGVRGELVHAANTHSRVAPIDRGIPFIGPLLAILESPSEQAFKPRTTAVRAGEPRRRRHARSRA